MECPNPLPGLSNWRMPSRNVALTSPISRNDYKVRLGINAYRSVPSCALQKLDFKGQPRGSSLNIRICSADPNSISTIWWTVSDHLSLLSSEIHRLQENATFCSKTNHCEEERKWRYEKAEMMLESFIRRLSVKSGASRPELLRVRTNTETWLWIPKKF